MLYKISYEATAGWLLPLLGLIVKLFYGMHSRKDKYFLFMMFSAFVISISNIFYGVGKSFEGPMYEAWAKYGNIVKIIFLVIFAISVTAYLVGSFARRKQILAYITFICVILLSIFLRIIFPNTLTIGFCLSIGILVLLFTLETPDYKKLLETREKLEKSRIKEVEAKNEADRAYQAKGRFLANMTHEIRTPINAIIGLDEIMLRESKNPEILNYALKMRGACTTLLNMVNDILDFSKIESGKMQLIYAKYNLRNVLQEIVETVEMELIEKGVVFELDIQEDLPNNLIGDDVRIKQIILNLLSNAVKYTDKGSVTLRISGKCAEDELDRILLKVEVIDTGVGIEQENLAKLFEQFEKLDSSNNKGIGIGINISVLLLELMNSELKVSSSFGEGSTFSFEIYQMINGTETIGAMDTKVISRPKYEYKESFRAPDAKILVVDDTELNLFVIKRLLSKTLIQIDTASSGYECLEKVKTSDYDIIFMDHMMPGMDGIETALKLWEIQGCEKIPVIALTASTASDDIDMFMKNNFSGFLTKPVEQDKIEEIIMKFVQDKCLQEDGTK